MPLPYITLMLDKERNARFTAENILAYGRTFGVHPTLEFYRIAKDDTLKEGADAPDQVRVTQLLHSALKGCDAKISEKDVTAAIDVCVQENDGSYKKIADALIEAAWLSRVVFPPKKAAEPEGDETPESGEATSGDEAGNVSEAATS